MAKKLEIEVDADTSSAEKKVGALSGFMRSSLVGALSAVRAAVSKVMMAFGLFGLAVEGVRKLVDGYRALVEWMNRAAAEAARARVAANLAAAAGALDRLSSSQERYNRLLKDEIAAEEKRQELRDRESSAGDEISSIRKAAARAEETAGVFDERRLMEIRQRWRVEDETEEREKREASLVAERDRAESRRDNLDWKAENAREEIERAKAERASLAAAAPSRRGDSEDAKNAREQADRLDNALREKIAALERNVGEWSAESARLSEIARIADGQIEALRAAPSVAQAENAAETAEFEHRLELQREQDRRESSDNAREFVRAYEDEQKRENEKRAGALEKWGDDVGALASSRGNRLTALGLGDGVSNGVDKDVKTIIDLVKQEIAAIKDNKPESRQEATYAP